MAANYKSCPLKKRPIVFVNEEAEQTEALALTKGALVCEKVEIAEELQPQDLSLKRKANFEEDYVIPSKREYVLNLSKTPEEMPFSSALLSPPMDIHLRGMTAATMGYTTNSNTSTSNSSPSDNPYQSAFVMAAGCNPISALWSNYQPHLSSSAFPSPASSISSGSSSCSGSPRSIYNYQQSMMTPPSSPGSDICLSEPEDLSVRNDIPLPALFHLFDEARTNSSNNSHISNSSSIKSNGITINSTHSSSSSASHHNIAKNYRYKCDKCQKMYSTSMGLSKHRQFHCPAAECNQEKKTHSCEECGKLYTSIGALKMHIRTHTLPCKCPICGKAFSRPWLLQGHIRTHTGEKPFQCPDCPRSFADRSNLRAHQQTHVEVKKYACQVCHKSFSRMSLLNKHTSSNCTITIV
ncbi:uncharacterized protein Dwil_GK18251 [Drosophila willistoni]|uniref:C2H2-type domain-containing protein n=1 Tax=Drosophila willistoni TaxID=7260 RepID=B4MZ09_DROWI|nr:protein snail [Drosophila willistoni]EDW77348.1 uncharacterized protein Dwil_GK18251 [Drosophila willistoni]